MEKIFIIAEAGVNHNGDIHRALDMVDVAAEVGADAIKFQTFTAATLVTAQAPKAGYQQQATGSGTQLSMLEALELSADEHFILQRRCGDRKIEFLSSPFDVASLRFLVDHRLVQRIKIPSGELTNGPLLWEAARTDKSLIVSTGMAHDKEIHMALRLIGLAQAGAEPSALYAVVPPAYDEKQLRSRVILLHCTTAYPTPMNQVNLRAMRGLKQRFSLPVGYSDHTEGITVPLAAAAMGARVIEKHFTLDRTLEGPDHRASLEPRELEAMIREIRQIELAMGDGVKRAQVTELDNARVARKSLHAAIPVAAGELFTVDNLAIKRPGTGRSPMDYWRLLGTPAERGYRADEALD
ncbi:MAG: N-acetylneuraminate synthase [Magnetococcales bacterium]|nr:N-acetylneuraminate synthase [Magnetococcales bacterium]